MGPGAMHTAACRTEKRHCAVSSSVVVPGQVRDSGHRGASVSALHTGPTAPSTRTVPAPSVGREHSGE